LPRQSPELAAAEAERAVRELGAAGVAITSGAVDARLLSDPAFEPLWETASRLDVPVGIHLYGTAPGMRDDVQSRYTAQPNSNLATAVMNGVYHGQSAIPELIGAGVPERFPDLRFMVMEVASTWLLWLLDKMDGMWEMYGPDTDVTLTMRPGDYVRRQFTVTVEADELALPYLVDLGLTDSLVFSTDYPHHDSPWPEGVSTLLRRPISDEAKRKILWDNAQRVFASREAALSG
jgi:predicted TIM-barrel fold metal-dependent hydrolase